MAVRPQSRPAAPARAHALLHATLLGWCVCLHLASGLGPGGPQDDAPFVGWQGEAYQPIRPKAAPEDPPASMHKPVPKPWIQTVSYKPRAAVYHGFLTPAEALHLRRLAMPQMRRSSVVNSNGSSVLDDYRSSYGAFIKRRSDPVVAAISKRIADWTKLPEIHQEDLQVLRYGQGQEYRVHMDTLQDEASPRVATVLMYLADTEEGGETIFPQSQGWADPAAAASMADASPCARGKVGARPRLGDAVLFWSRDPDGQTEDLAASHAACPVLKGAKWSAPTWIHSKPFRPDSYDTPEAPSKDPGLCVDDEPACAGWAASGECTKNPGFMVGTAVAPGRCRAACKACTPCKPGDKPCYNANRRSMGYLVYEPAELGWESVPGLGTAAP